MFCDVLCSAVYTHRKKYNITNMLYVLLSPNMYDYMRQSKLKGKAKYEDNTTIFNQERLLQGREGHPAAGGNGTLDRG